MQKIEEKRLALMEWTEKELKDRGVTIFMRKYWVIMLPVLAGIFVGMYYSLKIPDATISNVIFFCTLAMTIVTWWLIKSCAGDGYWDKLKNEKQPIKLERLPSIWWIFKRK